MSMLNRFQCVVHLIIGIQEKVLLLLLIIVVFVSMLFNSISITKVEHVESIELFIIRVMNVND